MAIRGLSIPLDVGATIVPLFGKTGNNTASEDNPSGPTPAVIYDMRNAMPTSLGYQSAFTPVGVELAGEVRNTTPKYIYKQSTRKWDDPEWVSQPVQVANMIKDARVQKVVPWETQDGTLMYLILTEVGIYLCHPFADSDKYDFGPTVGGSADPELPWPRLDSLTTLVQINQSEPDLLHLWTTAQMSGELYMFLQGQPHLFIVGDGTLRGSLDNREIAYELAFFDEFSGLTIVTSVPSFIDMEGQVGLFPAVNRLGFWDSSNAVAWSSPFNPLDFTPDVVSMAGITTFPSVSGDIIMILPTDKGFNIYSSSSITGVRSIGSAEVWGATSILDSAGIAYYFQVTCGSDNNTHFAWTQEGLFHIEDMTAKPYLVEEWREITQQQPNPLVSIFASGQDYLVISLADYWTGRPAELEIRNGIIRGDDWDYPFYLPTIKPEHPDWSGVILGDNGLAPDPSLGFEVVEPLQLPGLGEIKPLIPCFSGYAYRGPTDLKLDSLHSELLEEDKVPLPPYFTDYAYPHITCTRNPEILLRKGNGECEWVPNLGDEFMGVPSMLPTFSLNVDWLARPDIGYANEQFFDSWGTDFYDLIRECYERHSLVVNTLYGVNSELALSFPNIIDRRPTCSGTFVNPTDPIGAEQGWEFNGHSLDDWSVEPIELERLPNSSQAFLTQIPALVNTIAAKEARIAELEIQIPKAINERRRELLEQQLEAIQLSLVSDEEELLTVRERAEKLIDWVYNDDPLPYSNAYKIINQEVYSVVPFNHIPPVIIQDDCGIQIYAYIDDIVGVGIWQPEMNTMPEAPRECSSCTIPEYSPNYPECTGAYVPNGVIGLVGSGPGACRLNSTFSIYQAAYYYPKSFKDKTLDQILDMIDPANIKDNPNWVPIFQAEVSGYGYPRIIGSQPAGFTKTLSRAQLWMQDPDGGCTPSLPKIIFDGPPDSDEELVYEFNSPSPEDEWKWDWDSGQPELSPPSPPRPWDAQFAPKDFGWIGKWRRGTKAPYYPIYQKAWVRDLHLGKWGSMNTPHSSLFPTRSPWNEGSLLRPAETSLSNSSLRPSLDGVYSFGIVPKFPHPSIGSSDEDYKWSSLEDSLWRFDNYLLSQHQLPTFLAREGARGRLVIGDIALVREGMTKMTGLIADGLAAASISVMGSYTGNLFGSPSRYYSNEENRKSYNSVATKFNSDGSTDYGHVEYPFVLVGKEFRLAIEGRFRLDKLICYGEPTGRLYFRAPSGC